MRIIMIIGAAAGLFAAALPAQAANSTTNANRSDATARAPQANGASAADRRICVRETRSESHILRTICHTAREWRDMQGEVPGEE